MPLSPVLSPYSRFYYVTIVLQNPHFFNSSSLSIYRSRYAIILKYILYLLSLKPNFTFIIMIVYTRQRKVRYTYMSDININANLPESVDNAIKNVTDLPTQGIGQTLSDCWFLVFGGISQAAEKKRVKYAKDLEKFKKELGDSLETVPEQRRKEPTTQMVLKTLDEAKYCVEEEDLRQLFVALLTSATDSGKNVHPSFAQIIGQMSPNDAKILQFFKTDYQKPICNLKLIVDENGSFQLLSHNIFIDGPNNMKLGEKTISISSLIRLGLLEIPFDGYFTDESLYLGFKETAIYKNAKLQFPDNELELEKKIVRLTSLGKLFISCCFPNN
nr:MAG TPA: protein of unknown function (DUF4393) [Caudoviricetes sp.]